MPDTLVSTGGKGRIDMYKMLLPACPRQSSLPLHPLWSKGPGGLLLSSAKAGSEEGLRGQSVGQGKAVSWLLHPSPAQFTLPNGLPSSFLLCSGWCLVQVEPLVVV